MKAAVLQAARTLECKDLPIVVPGEGEVLVRVAYCGVCGSDVPRYLDGAVHFFPLVLGHEFSGEVIATGPGADRSLIGRRVAGIPLIPCGECADCRAGNYSLCRQYDFVGSRRNGAWAEYVAVPQQNVYPVSERVSDLQAAFFEPASVAQHAVNLAIPQRPGAGGPAVTASAASEDAFDAVPRTAAVVGCGTIGIFVAQILQDMGLKVTGLARRQVRLDAARAAGVANLCDTSQDGWQESLLAGQVRGGIDYVFDTSGNGAMMVKSLELAASKATVCMVGTPKRPMELTVSEWENLNRKELTLLGSWMSYSEPWPGREWDDVARLFEAGALRVVDQMIDGVYSLAEIAAGMEKYAEPNCVSGKLLVKCQ